MALSRRSSLTYFKFSQEICRRLRPLIDLAVCTGPDRKSTRLNSSHDQISYAVFCLKKKKKQHVDWNVVHRPMPELQPPEPVDDELEAVSRPERPNELECAVGQLLVRIHVAVSELARGQAS